MVINFVDIPYGRILRISASKEVTVAVEWDGEPNELAVDPEGKIAIADYKQGILTFDPVSRAISKRIARNNLERFKGPNNLIFDKAGNLYFTDQGQTGLTDPTGKVYRLSPSGKLDSLISNGVSPNGLALSPDERFLFVAMTRANAVWRVPLHPDDTVSKVGQFYQGFGNVGPDGLVVDEEGSLFVCDPGLGSIFVLNANGTPKARIVSCTQGINLTNCCFGGKDGKTLFITDSLEGNVQYVGWHCKGATVVPTLATKDAL